MPLIPRPPRIERPELIDSTEPDDGDFAASFRDVARVNRWLGGTRAIRAPLRSLILSLSPAPRPVTLLDLATGVADIPRSIVDAARRGAFGERSVQITALDNHPKVLALARRLSQGYPEIRIESGDVFALSYPDDTFDIVLCSLAFHHFGAEGRLRVLREMERISRVGFLVNDLIRDGLACALIWVLTRLLRANRLTRHDGPVSVLRACTVPEYVDMVHAAGIPSCEVRTYPFYRAVIVRRKRAGEQAPP